MLTAATAPLTVRTHRRGETAVVDVAGDLDVSNHGLLRDAVVGAVDEGASHVVVDLSGLSFLDAAGLGVLIGARRRAAEAGASLVVRRPSDLVRRVMVATGLAEYLTTV